MRYLTTKQAAEALTVSENTVRRRINEGLIKYHDIGVPGRPRIRITEEDLHAYVTGSTEKKAS